MYKRTIWQDHVPGVQEGTDMNAANFNNLEAGAMEANAMAAMMAAYRRYAVDEAENAKVVAIAATLTPSGTAVSVDIPLASTRRHTTYEVVAEITSITGESGATAGDIVISDKQANGFKAKFNGTATSVGVRFKVSGGMI